MPSHVADRRLGVTGLGHHLEVGLLLEQDPEGPPHDRVVVCEDDRDALRAAVILGRCSLIAHLESRRPDLNRGPLHYE